MEEEAARLEAERLEAIVAKEELARQAEDQLKGQEQLVGKAAVVVIIVVVVVVSCSSCSCSIVVHWQP